MILTPDPGWLLAAAALAPLLVLPLLPLLRGRSGLVATAAGALPALAAALVLPVGTALELPWLLLGARLELDRVAATFLLFTALLWLIAAAFAAGSLHADPGARRFAACFLLTMSGNIGLIVAADVPSFYAAFALMSLAAYGLVIHRGDPEARRAATVYLALVVVGEVALFVGMAMAASAAGTLALPGPLGVHPGGLAIALLVVGFGLKAGMLPLHVWLPLAHPAAPIAASAVLSGAMIKAGLLGLMRFLPLGAHELSVAGEILILAGIGGAFFGVLIGLTQSNPKTVLAYSSISQMGLMIVALGIAAAVPGAAPGAAVAIAILAVHHGLAKGALFLACGIRSLPAGAAARSLLGLGFVVPALALVGAPLTSGVVAKTALDGLAGAAPGSMALWLSLLLPASAVGTGLLMARFLILAWPKAGAPSSDPLALAAWGLAVAASASVIWLLPQTAPLAVTLLEPAKLGSALLPLVAAAVIVALVLGWRVTLAAGVPPGDLLVLPEGPAAAIWRHACSWGRSFAAARQWGLERSRDLAARLANLGTRADLLELELRTFPVAGAFLVLLGLAVLLLGVGLVPPEHALSAAR